MRVIKDQGRLPGTMGRPSRRIFEAINMDVKGNSCGVSGSGEGLWLCCEVVRFDVR